MANNEWRAYVRVDEIGMIVIEMDGASFGEFHRAVYRCDPEARAYREGAFEDMPPVIVKARSDETTLPGVRR